MPSAKRILSPQQVGFMPQNNWYSRLSRDSLNYLGFPLSFSTSQRNNFSATLVEKLVRSATSIIKDNSRFEVGSPVSTRGNRYLLVMIEYLSKWVISVALPSYDTNHVANASLFEVVLKTGLPERLITDNGSNFVSEAMFTVCQQLGIKRLLTSVEHPQTDGLVERMSRTIKTSLATACYKEPEL